MKSKSALDDADIQLIEDVIKTQGKNWSDDRLKPIKRKIKDYLKAQDCSCCYCRRSFWGEANFDIDIEHILPKKKFKLYEFHPDNLNIACKRCNMFKKGQRTDFLDNLQLVATQPFRVDNYKFPHPNLETYEDHLKLVSSIDGPVKLTKYVLNQNGWKGPFTREFFELQELEEDSMNKAQGIEEDKPIQLMSDDAANKLRDLIKKTSSEE